MILEKLKILFNYCETKPPTTTTNNTNSSNTNNTTYTNTNDTNKTNKKNNSENQFYWNRRANDKFIL